MTDNEEKSKTKIKLEGLDPKKRNPEPEIKYFFLNSFSYGHRMCKTYYYFCADVIKYVGIQSNRI